MSNKTFAVPISNTRNVTVLAHVDHGKTSFVDSLLSSNGIISSRLAGKIRFLDSREDEQERGITMESSAVSLRFEMKRAVREGQEPLPPQHILNLIDTPGHVDFASEVSTASRLCDGALVLVDSVEGVCTQTIAVLRQAWLDNLKPLLIINKLDRLITELKLTPNEAYHHLVQLLEQVNAVMGSFFASERMEDDMRWREEREERIRERKERDEEDGGTDTPTKNGSGNGGEEDQVDGDGEGEGYEEKEDEDIYFAPERGNVIFASAIDGWAFRLGRFAQLYGAKLGIKEHKLRSVLWGDFYLDPKTKRVIGRKKLAGRNLKPMFVQFVLENVWRVYETVLEEHNPDKLNKIITALNVKVTPRDMKTKDTRSLLTVIMQQWLPLSTCTFQAVVDIIPSPSSAQPIRLPRMLYPTIYTSPSTGLVPPKNDLEKDLYSCNQTPDSNVEVYVSKMFAVPRADLPEVKRKEVTAEEMRQKGREARERRLAAAAASSEVGSDINGEAIPLASEDLPGAAVPGDHLATEAVAEVKTGEALIGFARIYSGVLKRGSNVLVISPKYSTSLAPDHPANIKHIASVKIESLYTMMGRELVPVEEVPAGNIFAIGGLEGKVLRNATLCAPTSDGVEELFDVAKVEKDCIVNLASVIAQAAPIVRVALEPELPSDLPKLVEGLRLLNQADPCVEVLVQDTGEYVILTAGELHLERCLKDLRERFAKCPLTASEAIVPFRETAVKVAEMNPTKSTDNIRGKFSGSSVSSLVTFSIRAALLPTTVVDYLQKNASTISTLLADRRTLQEMTGVDENGHANEGDSSTRATKPQDFWAGLDSLLEKAGPEWKGVSKDVWAFGPRKVGPNMLIDRTGTAGRSIRAKSDLIASAQAEGKSDAEITALVADMSEVTLAVEEETKAEDAKAASRLQRDFDDAIETGFQIATSHGPLCAEPVQGMAWFVEEIKVNREEGDEDSLRSKLPQVTGSLITAVRDVCRNGLLDWSPRIMLAMYECDIQASTDVLGKVYAVVARRRGRIVSEEMKEGTSFFTIKAKLPVVESFGFADEIRKRTSGAASPQLIFSGFEMHDLDPFWVPTTEEELEDFGEKADKANVAKMYCDAVRRRKGMFVEEKVVEHAEKQRTLKR